MSVKDSKRISVEAAKLEVQAHLGVLDIGSLIEDGHKLLLFHGPRGGHRATYNKTTGWFWWCRK